MSLQVTGKIRATRRSSLGVASGSGGAPEETRKVGECRRKSVFIHQTPVLSGSPGLWERKSVKATESHRKSLSIHQESLLSRYWAEVRGRNSMIVSAFQVGGTETRLP